MSTGDPVRDKSYALAFASLAQEGHAVVGQYDKSQPGTLQVGLERWPLRAAREDCRWKWYFDAKTGRDEILFRRVGANELDAIERCAAVRRGPEGITPSPPR